MGNHVPEQVQHADVRAVGVEVVGLGADRGAQNHVQRVGGEGQRDVHAQHPGRFLHARLVEIHARQRKAAGHQQGVGAVEAQNARQQQRIAREGRLRKQHGQHRAQRRHIKGKAHDGFSVGQHADGN